ncbi:MAG TPA: cation diffusion facilitator family transporter [Frankiaceae bacterium]|nr:cation diffusion facilitator family transporter [Frankiaceae bacterium]
MASDSKGTVLLALGANFAIAIAKTIVGLITLSSAMLAESAHSWADTLNQIFLLTSLFRSKKPADSAHPFGYGKERFFWSLLAAVGIFVTGAGFSIFQGVDSLFKEHQEIPTKEFLLSYTVLAFAFVLEGSSLIKALRQVKGEAETQDRGFVEHLRKSNDPTVKTVASEDSAAVTGIIFAFVGLLLHQITGSAVFDGIASIAIGVLLAWIAYALGRDTKDLLIGEAADPELRLDIIHAMSGFEEVDGVVEMLTMQLGPDEILLAVKVDFADGLDSQRIEDLSTEIDEALRREFPIVKHVFLDATTATPEQREVASEIVALAQADADGDKEAADQLAEIESHLGTTTRG